MEKLSVVQKTLKKTIFPKRELHNPHWFLIDAKEKTLGRLAVEVSTLLRGKTFSHFTPGVDQGNYVIIINASEIEITGKKKFQKLYYRTSRRPGSLKTETFQHLQSRIPTRIVEKAIWGMLPKNVLGRAHYRRLYVFAKNINEKISHKKTDVIEFSKFSLKNLWKYKT